MSATEQTQSQSSERAEEQRQTVRDLIRSARFAMVTTADSAGALVSRPMTVQEVRDNGDIVFIVPKDGDTAQQADGAQVNLAFNDDMSFVSVAGVGEISEDADTLAELWGPGTDAFSEKDETPDNTNKVLLIVRGESAQYWDSPSRPSLMVRMISGIVSDQRPTGDSGTVEL
ncbi:Pyridoxamine 5'-phosphate oxidase [Corynebacterium ciconiae DSM 44920]|uniref:pyridoxamine 5'-phosphate oxidase family protein n=1 Tax=Corynebacterium ciconiae TaxID=227319 RepID=UPI000364332C|nr:pyridoxamine 5'-phosphate oxidase family protein [Corynebacterium ciconiae]WKD62173.1 Pyridoxamine 5'-phosphate oxidase [Corynebacterium ciconiae DSM 44920]